MATRPRVVTQRRSARWIGAACLVLAAVAVGLMLGIKHGGRRDEALTVDPDLAKGPYLQDVTPTRVTVCWQTREPSVGKVMHREPGGTVWQVASTKLRSLHQVRIVGLKPATRYEYRIASDRPLTDWLAFTTAKRPGQPFRFAVYGDNRMNFPVHQRVCRHMLREHPEFAIHTGDLVDDGRQQEQWDVFFGAARELIAQVPLFVTLGNHEHEAPPFFDLFVLPGNEVYYSYDYGDVHFVSLQNSGPDIYERDQQLAWLDRDLAAHGGARFLVAIMHRPPYTTGWAGMRALDREFIVPILEKHRVSLVLSGHDHGYQRNVVNGMTYVVTAGAGAFRYGFWRREPWVVTRRVSYNYCIADVTPSEMRFRVYGLNGEVLDDFVLPGRTRGGSGRA